MIIFFESGRLGNQLFQYCALKRFQKKGAIFLVGMRSLKDTFQGIEVAGGTRLAYGIERIVRRLGTGPFDTLARKLRLIGYIKEHRTPNGSEFRINNGLLKNIHYCGVSYFHAENMVDHSIASKLELKTELLEYASKIFKKFPRDRTETFFVHVRRGDYTHWPSPDAPAVLPLRWYRQQMETIRSRCVKPFFLVVSDDGPYAAEMFGNNPDVFVSHESEAVDLALMSLCSGGGVLSASSFSWWAAYFARRANNDAFFIAPLYWIGHPSGSWFPEGIETSWLNYAAVE